RFCAVAELPADDRFATNRQRVTAYDQLRPIVASALKSRHRGYWIDRLGAAGVPCGSVRNLAEVFDDAQLESLEMSARVEHARAGDVRMIGVPIKLSDTPGGVRTAPPTLGQHTDAILGNDLGMRADAIDALRRQSVI